MPELKETLAKEDPLFKDIQNFEKTGQLPIPIEGNFYEAMWNATLEERLVLMHHDSESSSLKLMKKRLGSEENQKRPHILLGLNVVFQEEATHARLGKKWLRYLLPDHDERRAMMNSAHMLRGVLLLTTCAHHHNKPLNHIVTHALNH